MFRRFVALFLIAGACSAYPHNDETTVRPHPPAESFVDPETGQFDPERGPVDPGSPISLERDPVDPERVHPETLTPEEGHVEGVVEPERGPFPAQNVPVSAEVSEDISAPQDGPKREGDLKTDATSWWPFYRSFWGYPSYTRRSYWTYPYYRYYRPRSYYRYYYW